LHLSHFPGSLEAPMTATDLGRKKCSNIVTPYSGELNSTPASADVFRFIRPNFKTFFPLGQQIFTMGKTRKGKKKSKKVTISSFYR